MSIARTFARLKRLFGLITVENALICGGAFLCARLAILAAVVVVWKRRDFGPLSRIREMVVATTFILIGVQTIFGGLFVSLLGPDDSGAVFFDETEAKTAADEKDGSDAS